MMMDDSPEDANTRYVNDSPQQIAVAVHGMPGTCGVWHLAVY